MRVLEGGLNEEEGSTSDSWINNSFVSFYHCLGMPTEGFEGEILSLMKRMQERKELKGNRARKRRKVQKASRFERELKKLKCSVNYGGLERCVGDLKLAK